MRSLLKNLWKTFKKALPTVPEPGSVWKITLSDDSFVYMRILDSNAKECAVFLYHENGKAFTHKRDTYTTYFILSSGKLAELPFYTPEQEPEYEYHEPGITPQSRSPGLSARDQFFTSVLGIGTTGSLCEEQNWVPVSYAEEPSVNPRLCADDAPSTE